MSEKSELLKESFAAGDLIFLEGDLDFHFYIVKKGKVQIFTKNKNGERINIIEISEGESFGEFALLEKDARSASAQALTNCVLIKVSEQGYDKLLSEIPVWASCMLKSFAGRLKKMNTLLKDVPQFISRDAIEAPALEGIVDSPHSAAVLQKTDSKPLKK